MDSVLKNHMTDSCLDPHDLYQSHAYGKLDWKTKSLSNHAHQDSNSQNTVTDCAEELKFSFEVRLVSNVFIFEKSQE